MIVIKNIVTKKCLPNCSDNLCLNQFKCMSNQNWKLVRHMSCQEKKLYLQLCGWKGLIYTSLTIVVLRCVHTSGLRLDLDWDWPGIGLWVAFTPDWPGSGLPANMLCEGSALFQFLFYWCTRQSAVHLYSGQLPHHGNQSISSPKSVRLRSHLLESDLSFFPAHLD